VSSVLPACSHAVVNHQRICMQEDNEFDDDLFPNQPPHLLLQLPHLHSVVIGNYEAWQALPCGLSLKYLEDLDLLVGSNPTISRSAVGKVWRLVQAHQ
jgi:hypothetical protein